MRVLVTGAGGFIGGHLVKRLLDEGHSVAATDLKNIEDWHQVIDPRGELPILNASGYDLKIQEEVEELLTSVTADGGAIEQIFNLAADMGGMGFIANNKLDCMTSVLINTHLLLCTKSLGCERYFFSSSACVYPGYKQNDTDPNVLDRAMKDGLKESDAYPADPEDGYGWEKLFSERMCRHYTEEEGLETRVARYHNVYGPYGTWDGGREKAPAAICRKVAQAVIGNTNEIEVWGDGEQTRSFMYIDDCIEGTLRLMNLSTAVNHSQPLNIGSDELVSINELVNIVSHIAHHPVKIKYVEGPQGVRGRNSDNTLCREVLNWEPSIKLLDGLERTYAWIYDEVLRSAL